MNEKKMDTSDERYPFYFKVLIKIYRYAWPPAAYLSDWITASPQALEFVHVHALQFQGRVNVPVQRDADIGMSQYLAQRFRVEPDLHAARGESMPGRMEIGVFDAAG